MIEIIDKALLFLLCSVLYIQHFNTIFILIPIIVIIILSCFCSYYELRKLNQFGTLFYALLCIIHPQFLFYIPLQLYDISHSQEQKYGLSYFIPIVMHFQRISWIVTLWLTILGLVSFIAKKKKDLIVELTREYYTYRDSSKELEIVLEERNRRIMESQDDKIYLATLQERNRIAKEIHDNIGHILSRSLLQIGALISVTKDEILLKNLNELKNSLSAGMDNIRTSIHNLHDQSIDLYASINELVNEFTFCPVTFDYHIKNVMNTRLKYFFLSTIKEALSNIIKHSNASKASIVLMEHPIMYQLIITDNGSSISTKELSLGDGIGLQNMKDRTNGFQGVFHLSTETGFRIFITIPINEKEAN